MTVYICVGSSCHLKCSYNIIELMKEALVKYNLNDKVELKAAFCLGRCTSGVTMKVDDEIVTGISPDNFDSIFEKKILAKFTEVA